MESPPFVFRMHGDHEPADRAVASWTAPVLWRFRLARLHCQSARRLAQSKTCRGHRRFMESPLSLFRMHWDHEPCEWSAELLFGTMPARRMQNTVPNWNSALRFMESLHAIFGVHWV